MKVILTRITLLMSFLFVIIGTTQAQDLKQYFKDTNGAIVLYDLKNNKYIRHNEQRCGEPFSPFSTFKIPNSLIGLETGVIKDAETVTRWNQELYPAKDAVFPEWNADQTLRTAFKYSVVWYYREVAKSVGEKRMAEKLKLLNYGNQDISSGINRFWLGRSLQISADEQIEFLKKLYSEKFSFSKRSISIVKDIMIAEETPEYKLRAKTGGGPINKKALGWYVGWLETKDNVYFFALNIEGDTYESIKEKRKSLTREILTGLGYMK